MLEPPPTDTATKSLKGAENAIISHGRVQGYAMQRLRLKLSKYIVEYTQGHRSLQGSNANHHYFCSALYLGRYSSIP